MDTTGKVVSLNTRGTNMGGDMAFTVPVETIRMLLADLREFGEVRWSWFGLRLQALRDFDRNIYFDATEEVIVGVTARDMTYELRRYYQRPEGEPGVVVSKIESGSKASVAGVKPYELITAVNDQPVADVAEFEAQLKDVSEVRLSIRRMTRERVVMVTLPEKEDSEDAESDKDTESGVDE